MTRKLATLKTITEVRPIPHADQIETAIVEGGWPTVVKKGKFSVGETVLFLEIDSWVPYDLAQWLFKGKEPEQYKNRDGIRLTTQRFKGQISQGLALKLRAVNEGIGYPDSTIWEGAYIEGSFDPMTGGEIKLHTPYEDQDRLDIVLDIIKHEDKKYAGLEGQ